MTVKEEGRQFTEVFKSLNVPNPDRRYIRHVHFLRDSRTGLHGLVVFKNDSFQIWSISGYESGLKADLNKDVRLFPTTPVDIRVFGRGSDLYMIATSAVSTVYIVQLDAESERLKVEKKPLKNVLFVRPLPDRSGFVAVTKEAKLAKYSPDGEPLNAMELPDRMIPKSFAVSPNGKLAAMGGGRAELLIFDLESLELQHKIEAGYGAISQLAFTADGNGILVSGEQTVVRLFTLEDLGSAMPWVQSRQFAHHTAKVVALATVSTPEGERFATSSIDGEVCLWSLRNEEPLHVHRLSQEAATALNFSPDGNHLALGTDEGSLRVFRVANNAEFAESEEFIGEAQMLENFWDLEGPTVFEPQPLRKFLGIFKDDEEGIFARMAANPGMKLREAYHSVQDDAAGMKRREFEALRGIRHQRRRARRIATFNIKTERQRMAAARHGQPFEAPEMPAFDTEPEDDGELSDIEKIFEAEDEEMDDLPVPAEENKENVEEQEPLIGASSSSAASPTSSPDGDGEQPTLAQQTGILLSDSDEDDAKSPPTQEPKQEGEAGDSAPASPVQENEQEGQLWATSDEEEGEQPPKRKAGSPHEDQSPLQSPPDDSNPRSPAADAHDSAPTSPPTSS